MDVIRKLTLPSPCKPYFNKQINLYLPDIEKNYACTEILKIYHKRKKYSTIVLYFLSIKPCEYRTLFGVLFSRTKQFS